MARKNKMRSTRMSIVARRTMYGFSIIVTLCVVTIFHHLASSTCTGMMKKIGEKERLLARLEDEQTREAARWEEIKSNRSLEKALRDFGMAMHYAKPAQMVRLNADGSVRPGQISVAKMAERSSASRTVQYRAAARGRR
ncbi:MAG: hypothetical protein IKD42_00085 [Kiritimatiellae bacterium]|nr:hypothetical protein [Kiritimatiellia bacterium]